MLLTPEEIDAVYESVLNTGWAYDSINTARAMNKAQLKKVVGWLRRNNGAKIPEETLIVALTEDWQSLLREVK